MALPAELVVRPARPADREFVAGLAAALLEFAPPALGEPEDLLAPFQAMLARAVSEPEGQARVLIAEDGDRRPLGFISLQIRDDAAGTPRAHVADLAVAGSARRRGVGSGLMAAAEAWAQEQGLARLSLNVWATNESALAFYDRLGYHAESLSLVKTVPAGPGT